MSNQIKKTQEDLVLPAILVLSGFEKLYSSYGLNYNGVTTAVLKDAVLSGLEGKLSEEDEKKLKNRNDRAIDQTFRNLISHKVLENRNFVEFSEDRRMTLKEDGYKELFVNFNQILVANGRAEIKKEDTYKLSVFNALNDGIIPVKNKYLNELGERIKELIKERLEKSQTAEKTHEVEKPESSETVKQENTETVKQEQEKPRERKRIIRGI